ncbi:DUF695 domain-containing protein [Fulvitalea axinellae]
MFDIFKSREQERISTYEGFWNWFLTEEKSFFKVLSKGENVERDFCEHLSPKLKELREGFFFLAGMLDDKTAELIISADGRLRNIPYVEELIESAPKLGNWKFTGLKPASDIQNTSIRMSGYEYHADNMWFYAIKHERYPDEIDIVITHDDFNQEDKVNLESGVHIFLDNYLGELNFAVSIDRISLISPSDAEKELIPISKLKDYLIWREKEFVEKYEATYYDSENDSYSALKGNMKDSGNSFFATINNNLLEWDAKPSHPWVMEIDFTFEGPNGMPDERTYKLLDVFEDELTSILKDSDGFLNVGRETGDNHRRIYFACKDFRKATKVIERIMEKYEEGLKGDFMIYKDKYWLSFRKFMA